MTEDITSLQIKILYDSVTEAERRLKTLEGTAGASGKALAAHEKNANSLTGSLIRLAAGYVTVHTAISAFKAIIQTTAEFQQLHAALQTAVGSSEKAAVAFQAIQDFAQQTPYDLQQSTKAFISLVNRGLEPSERAMTSYGNTASAMTMTLAEMVNAVSKATTGEFEPLKAFGINAKRDADNVAFTFRGVKTTVKNNIKDIEKYFIELGEKNFGNGMALQMKTLNGAFSNFGDAWDVLKNSIGEQGLGDMVQKGVLGATDLLTEFTNQIKSGQVEAAIAQWGVAFDGYTSDFRWGIGQMDELILGHSKTVAAAGQSSGASLTQAFLAAALGIRASIETVATILWGLVAKVGAIGSAIVETMGYAFALLVVRAAKAGQSIATALNPFRNGQSFSEMWKADNEKMAVVTSKVADQISAKWKATGFQVGMTSAIVKDGVNAAWNEAKGDLGDMVKLDADAAAKRKAYDDAAAKRAADKKDRLKPFGLGGNPNPDGNDGKEKKDKDRAEFDSMAKALGDQENLFSQSYQRRLDIIEKFTVAGSHFQMEMELSLTEKYAKEQQTRIDALKNGLDTYREGMNQELQLITELYDKRKAIILAATESTEEEKSKLLEDAAAKRDAALFKNLEENVQTQTEAYKNLFDNLQVLADAFGKRGFLVAKAVSIANAIVSGIEAAIHSFKFGAKIGGPPAGFAFAAVSAAATGAQIAKIASTQYTGTHATGGFIPAGKYGIAGETGPEFVQGPAMITSAASTADRLANPAGKGGAEVHVSIVNNTGAPVTETRTQQGDRQFVQFVVGQAKQGVADDIRKGGNPVARALEGTYKLGRGR